MGHPLRTEHRRVLQKSAASERVQIGMSQYCHAQMIVAISRSMSDRIEISKVEPARRIQFAFTDEEEGIPLRAPPIWNDKSPHWKVAA